MAVTVSIFEARIPQTINYTVIMSKCETSSTLSANLPAEKWAEIVVSNAVWKVNEKTNYERVATITI